MEQVISILKELSPNEGPNQTRLQGVKTYKASGFQPRTPLTYGKGVILLGQGEKYVYHNEKKYVYNPDNYLVLSVPIPAECETYASSEKPLLALIVDIDTGVLHQIIGKMSDDLKNRIFDGKANQPSLYTAQLTEEIKSIRLRLLKALQSDDESRILGRGLINELLYHILCGENSAALFSLAMHNSNLARVDKALKTIHDSFNQSINVDNLAALVSMSPSAFHRAFKDVTASSPIQYVKKIRLNKAHSLLFEQGLRVNEAANEVGYESATQFSREFKRYFGLTPVEVLNQNWSQA